MIGAAIGRSDIADYVGALFLVYLILIFIRVLMSWIPRMPYNRYLRAAVASPGGSTEAGLEALDRGGATKAFEHAVQASMERMRP